jgi:hypothetical protein
MTTPPAEAKVMQRERDALPRETVLELVRGYRDNAGGSASYRQACNHVIEGLSVLRASTPSASAGELVEGVKALSQFVRHKELCAVIGGYGFCSCGLEAAQNIVAAALTEARAGENG